MKKLEAIVIKFISELTVHNFQKYLWICIASLLVSMGTITYLIYQKTNSLREEIVLIQRKAVEARGLMVNYQKALDFKSKITKRLESENSSDIKGFFENLCREQNLTPESNWTPAQTALSFNRELEEFSLQAQLKNMTMQRLVSFLIALRKNEMIYLKTLHISKDAPEQKTFNVELIVATYNYKHQ
jgi:hypothetical protein